jgi:hypothetical protein
MPGFWPKLPRSGARYLLDAICVEKIEEIYAHACLRESDRDSHSLCIEA